MEKGISSITCNILLEYYILVVIIISVLHFMLQTQNRFRMTSGNVKKMKIFSLIGYYLISLKIKPDLNNAPK